jgi:agmatine/peptidylarginine deiminase
MRSVTRQGTIVPDYRRPAALMVPHEPGGLGPVLEAIAVFAARRIGVVLLSRDPEGTRGFVAAQPQPERFSVVTVPFNTPWVRDRSPVAVRERDGAIRWVATPMPETDRPLDDALFGRITRAALETVSLVLPQGNLVAGPGGLAISTARVRADNRGVDRAGFAAAARRLGIRRWIVSGVFTGDATAHADTYARFLRPDLVATAWSETLERDREVIADLEARIVRARPGVEIVRLPLRSVGPLYASPLNWIQLGRTLLVPRFALTPAADVERIRTTLAAAGFRAEFIDAPSADLGGALHCLTASIYVSRGKMSTAAHPGAAGGHPCRVPSGSSAVSPCS